MFAVWFFIVANDKTGILYANGNGKALLYTNINLSKFLCALFDILRKNPLSFYNSITNNNSFKHTGIFILPSDLYIATKIGSF